MQFYNARRHRGNGSMYHRASGRLPEKQQRHKNHRAQNTRRVWQMSRRNHRVFQEEQWVGRRIGTDQVSPIWWHETNKAANKRTICYPNIVQLHLNVALVHKKKLYTNPERCGQQAILSNIYEWLEWWLDLLLNWKMCGHLTSVLVYAMNGLCVSKLSF